MTGAELLTLGKGLLWFLVPLLLAGRELWLLRRSAPPADGQSGRCPDRRAGERRE